MRFELTLMGGDGFIPLGHLGARLRLGGRRQGIPEVEQLGQTDQSRLAKAQAVQLLPPQRHRATQAAKH